MELSKEWLEKRAKLDEGQDCSAGRVEPRCSHGPERDCVDECHPLNREAYLLGLEIEKFPPSEQQTKIMIMLSELRKNIRRVESAPSPAQGTPVYRNRGIEISSPPITEAESEHAQELKRAQGTPEPQNDTESIFRAWMAKHSTTDYIGGELRQRAAIEFAEYYAAQNGQGWGDVAPLNNLERAELNELRKDAGEPYDEKWVIKTAPPTGDAPTEKK